MLQELAWHSIVPLANRFTQKTHPLDRRLRHTEAEEELLKQLRILSSPSHYWETFAEGAYLARRALSLELPASESDWDHRAQLLDCIIGILAEHFQRSPHEEIIPVIVSLSREFLEQCPPQHTQSRCALQRLANFLWVQFDARRGKIDCLEAVKLHRKALELCAPTNDDYADSLMMLSQSLHGQYLLTGDLTLINESIDLSRQALSHLPVQLNNKAHYLHALANHICARSGKTKTLSELQEAILLQREAFGLCPVTDNLHILILDALSSSLYLLHLRTRDGDPLEEVITLRRMSLEFCMPSNRHNYLYQLSQFLLLRYNLTSDLFALEEAMVHASEALSLGFAPAYERLQAAQFFLTNLCTTCLESEDFPIEAGRNLLNLLSSAVNLLPQVLSVNHEASLRLSHAEGSDDFAALAASVALALQDEPRAIELLEGSRAVFWRQALGLRLSIDACPDDERDGLSNLLRILEDGFDMQKQHEIEDQDVYLFRINEQVNQVLERIRKRDSFDRFLLPHAYNGLTMAAASGPVIVLLANESLCEALILNKPLENVVRVTLPDIQTSDVAMLGLRVKQTSLRARSALMLSKEGIDSKRESVLGNDAPSDGDKADERKAGRTKPRSFDDGAETLDTLWVQIVQPIMRALDMKKQNGRQRPRLHWCPTGQFSFLPLHAAYASQTTGTGCSDYCVSSYTPTITTLLETRKNLQPINVGTATALLVAVASAPAVPKLYSAIDEILTVAKILSPLKSCTAIGATRLLADAPRMQSIVDRLPDTSIFHLACHGEQHQTNPLQSAFCLQDGRLTVQRLIRANSKRSFMAFLSACETAKGGADDQSDQAVHLGAAMLYVGFRSVIATMWSMNDEDGPSVASTVYGELLKGRPQTIAAEDIPYALDTAVQKLRRQGLPSHRWAPYIYIGA